MWYNPEKSTSDPDSDKDTVGNSDSDDSDDKPNNSEQTVAHVTYVESEDGTFTATSCDGQVSELTVYSEINGKKLNAIANEAFKDQEQLTKVVISDGITAIGSGAFKNCTSLSEISIPDSVNKIAENAFYNCKNITFVCNEDSYAYNYALLHGISCRLSTINNDTDTESEADDTDSTEDKTSDNDTNSDKAADDDKKSDTNTDQESDDNEGSLGDLDNDGQITAADALAILRMSVGLSSDDKADADKLADVDGDNAVTAADALEILRFSVGLSSNEMIGKETTK